eukprot:XP_025000726.1 protein FAM71B-like isoform X2 [Gallus gallus]
MEVQRAQEARPAGPLQRLLQEGEFGLLSHTLILESNFFQVGRHGEVLNVSKRVQEVTMGVAETGPATGVPNVILMAVPAAPPAEGLELTRLLPLQCVKLAVYGRLQHCLRLRFPTGRKVYLQLCPGPRAEELFLHWAALVTVLPVPGEPSIHPTPAGEPVPGGEACSTGVTQPEVEAEVEVKVPATDPSMGKIGTTGEIAGMDEAPPASSTPEVRTDRGMSPGQGRRFRHSWNPSLTLPSFPRTHPMRPLQTPPDVEAVSVSVARVIPWQPVPGRRQLKRRSHPLVGVLLENGRSGGEAVELPSRLPRQVMLTRRSLYGVGKENVMLDLRLSLGKGFLEAVLRPTRSDAHSTVCTGYVPV